MAHRAAAGGQPALHAAPGKEMEEEDVSDNIEALKEQVEMAIKSVDESLIDSMLVGQTKIQKNKAVILSWSLDQTLNPSSPQPEATSSSTSTEVKTNKDDSEHQEDGIVLYVAIKMKKKSAKEICDLSESEDDPNNNNNNKTTANLSRFVIKMNCIAYSGVCILMILVRLEMSHTDKDRKVGPDSEEPPHPTSGKSCPVSNNM